ncbi:hypothetical protein WA538_003938, partial [Blastocystis sp. DL]
MTPIIQILSCSDFYWFLADNGLLVKIACASLESSVDTNIHAFISCKDVENLQKVECGSIPQQRYQLSCQKSIHQISITLTDKTNPSSSTESERSRSTESSSESAKDLEESFLVVAAGMQPPICSYVISQDTKGLSVGTIAASMAKSIVGAVRSLAGWGWGRQTTEPEIPIPESRTVRSNFEVIDSKRESIRVWTCPSGRYTVISDSLSRVLCVDLYQGLVIHLWKGYRDVQCVWTQTSVMVKGKEIELPLLLLFSENRSYLEAYRVPSFSRVLNYYFPFPCRFVSSPLGEFLLFDKEEKDHVVTTFSRIILSCNLETIQIAGELTKRLDIVHKNTVIRQLIRSSRLPQQNPELMNSIREEIRKIQHPGVYVQLLEDCFRCGIDLTQTYSALVEMCVEQVKQLSSARQLQVKEEDLQAEEVVLEEPNESVVEKLEYYTMVISWYYVLLDHWRKRQARWKNEEEDVIKHNEEIPRWEKAYSDQFVIADKVEASPSYTYRDLPQWIQCIQPTKPYRIRSENSLSRASRSILFSLAMDCLYDQKELVFQFFKEFGNSEESSLSPLIEYLVPWILQIPIHRVNDAFFSSFSELASTLLAVTPNGSLNKAEEDLLVHAIQTSTSPGHALLLCLVLQADYHKKEREEEAIHLIHQVRAVTVLSMAVNSRISIENVTENTVQYYLAYLNIPVEYIRFDNENFSVDLGNWKNLLDIALHPHSNYISLLSLFLPVSSFYTIFIQIVVNRLNQLDATDFSYMLRVLELLSPSRRYAFARFCWRIVASYAQESIRSDSRQNRDLASFIVFMANTKKLLELIRRGVDSESTTPTEEAKAQITLEAYPFPITKGCYITIEQQYAGSLSEAENRSVDEAIHIITVVGVAAQLKLNKAFPVSIIPSIASMFPDWEQFIVPSFPPFPAVSLSDHTLHQRTKFMMLCLSANKEGAQQTNLQVCQALEISPAFYGILRGCLQFLAGKDDKGDRLCRGVIKDLTEEEEKACEYELTSAVQAFIQESIQWTNQNRRVRLFDYLPERLVTWLDSHPSSGKVTNPSITTSISMIRRILRYLPPGSENVPIMKDLMTELGNCLRK